MRGQAACEELPLAVKERLSALQEDSFEALDRAFAEHKPVMSLLLFSGGHDSLVATHLTSRWAKERGVLFAVAHINTGIGIEKTREFVRSVCRQQGWPLWEEAPPQGTYERLVLKYGFPGPAAHAYMYRYLKERQVRTLVRRAKTGRQRVFLVTGVRREESRRRMLHARFNQRFGSHVWMAPLEHWTKRDCFAYIDEHRLPRNEVVDLLHMSGECLCGAYAHKDEMRDLEIWFPEVASYLHALEKRVAEAGKASCRWGYSARYASMVSQDQLSIFSPLCVSCIANEDL